MARKRNKLKPQHRLFIDAYLSNGCNGTQAAISAGYKPSNARFCASRLLTIANIKAELDSALEDAGVSRHAVLKAMAESAFKSDLADFEQFTSGNATLKSLRASGLDTRHVKKIKVGEDGITIELTDRQRALEQLAKALRIGEPETTHAPAATDAPKPDAPVDGIAFPSGTIPALPPPGAIQDSARGEAKRQDGAGETETHR